MMFLNTYHTLRSATGILANDKGKFYFAVFLCILGGAVELVGVGTLYPFLALLSKPKLIETNAALQYLYTSLNCQSPSQFLFWSGCAGLLSVFVASLFMYLKMAYIIRFCVGQTARISVRLLDAYLRKPMLFHIERNSSELSKDVIIQSDQFTNGILVSVMTIISDGIIMLILIGLILTVDMQTGLVAMGVMGAVLGTTLVYTRNRIQDLAKKNDEANGARFVYCVGALQSAKEIKTAGKEDFFSGMFRRHAVEFGRSYANVSVLQLLPQSIVQFVAAGAVISIALYYLATGAELASIVPTLAIYAVAGYRLMPSFNRLSLSLSQLQQFRPAANNIRKVLAEYRPRGAVAEAGGPAGIAHPAIEFRTVGFSYPGSERPVFREFDLKIEGHGFVCLVGASGSGKTTLVDMLLGLLPPDQGEIRANGVSMREAGEQGWRNMFGYVPQAVYMIDGTIAENIAFGMPEAEIDREKLRRVVKLCHLEDFVDSHPEGLDFQVGEHGSRLSGGQKQRIGIARALYRDPPILILDESTSSLDGISERKIIEALNELSRHKTIISIAHRSSLVRSCGRVIFISHGEVEADGHYEALCRTSPQFLELMSELERH